MIRGGRIPLLPTIEHQGELQLMKYLPELLRRAQYSDVEAQSVLAMIKSLNLSDLGIEPIQ